MLRHVGGLITVALNGRWNRGLTCVKASRGKPSKEIDLIL